MPARFLFAWFILIAALPASWSAEISTSQLPNGAGVIIVSGELRLGDQEDFQIKISSLRPGIVLLSGPGGNLKAGIDIGRTIRLRQWATLVPDDNFCVSACALAWLGGARRAMAKTAYIGFHAASVGDEVHAGANALVGAYLKELAISDAAILFMTSAAPDSMVRLTPERAALLGLTVQLFEPEKEVSRSSSPASPTPAKENKYNESRAIVFLQRYYSAISSDNEAMLRFLDTFYSDTVAYFGKPTARQEVLSLRQRFANRWPTRRYRMQSDTVKVSCEQLLCRASGVIDFDSFSEHRRERSVGQATFEIVLQFPDDGGAPKVVSEGGSVVARRIEAAPFLAPFGPTDGRSAVPPDRHRIQ